MSWYRAETAVSRCRIGGYVRSPGNPDRRTVSDPGTMVDCDAMKSDRIVRHVFRLSAIAERRRSKLAAGVFFLLEIAGSRADSMAYLRRAARDLRRASRG